MKVEIRVGEKTIACLRGENLREVLMRHDIISPYHHSGWGICKGALSCGTCTVKLTGSVMDMRTNRVENKLGDPCLSCKIKVEGNLHLEFLNGAL
ncbi:MAG: 2Fe-2S iron-sulfur cluster binding domain-containing protein [Flavobacteriales bacterium]|nr:2Fe-2S iron-sulfur cluster binding domain-containing protein [Flavobacteriales bacterium]